MMHQMKKVGTIILICLFAAVILAACGKTETAVTETNAADDVGVSDVSASDASVQKEETTVENTTTGQQNDPLDWQGYTLDWQANSESDAIERLSLPEVSGERYILIIFTAREGKMLLSTIADRTDGLCLSDKVGTIYKPQTVSWPNVTFDYENGFKSAEEQDSFTLVFSVPNAVQDADFYPIVSEESAESIPEELAGSWSGSVTPENGNTIDLALEISTDGTGYYTFQQGGYEESYPIAIENDDKSFSVSVPENNKLEISVINGTYEYADGVLSLHINTEFRSGRSFNYDIDCVKQ